MERKTISVIDHFLAVIASHYMKNYQGDILYDHQTIMERLETEREIECYVSKSHFDTEKRFEFSHDENTVKERIAKARQKARKQHWGEYIVRLSVDDHGNVHATIEKRNENVPPFPLSNIECVCIDEYDIIDDYGKTVKGEKKNP